MSLKKTGWLLICTSAVILTAGCNRNDKPDATACCSQGIEFELTDDHKYPDDYPKEGSEICVTGTFDTYDEGEAVYCTLRDARLTD